jgi:1,4-dihydroxy-6-naphthoate synthase
MVTMTAALRLGFSSCPNDTFAFHALVHGLVAFDVPLVPVIEDIEALNERALASEARRLPLTKLSVGALPVAAGRYAVMRAGAALGRGCGPLVVASREASLASLSGRRVAIPGVHTTAWLLMRAFAPAVEPVAMRFDRIMPAVERGEVDAGLVIHEGRFTYAARGLVALADLGELWEAQTGLPLPLGVIAADRALAPAVVARFEDALSSSVAAAMREPSSSRGWIREHAQELDDDVVARHIALYVNDFTVDLGGEGRAAIDELLARAGSSVSPWR